MRRALFVAFHFAPENTSGTHRSLHFARRLADEGVEVTVLTRALDSISQFDRSLEEVFPWPDRVIRVAEEKTRLDRWIAAIRSAVVRRDQSPESSGGTGTLAMAGSMTRSPAPDSARRTAPRRFPAARAFLDWSQRFPDVHKGWLAPAVRVGRELITRQPYDLVFASGPPWTGLLVGERLGREGSIPFIADFRDPWTRASGRSWNVGGPLFDYLGGRLERRLFRTARLTLANSPGISDAIRDSYSNPGERDHVTILNGSDARRRSESRPFPYRGDLAARHFGSLYAGRRIAPLLEAAVERIEGGSTWRVEQFGPAPADVDLAGVADEALGLLAVNRALPFRDAVERMHEPGLLVVIQPAILKRQVPTKLYDYLCSGNPVLVMATEDSAAWRVARRFPRAFRADPDDARGIQEVLAELEARHRAGELRQEATDVDTVALSKQSIGDEFIQAAFGIAHPTPSP